MSTTLHQSDLTAQEVAHSQRSFDCVTGTKPRIKICFLIDSLSLAGTENHLLGLIESLDHDRFEPILVLLDGNSEASRKLEPSCCQVVRLGIDSFLRPSIAWKTISFARWLRSQKIDVLQMYFPDSSLLGAIAGRLAGVKKIIRTRRNSGHWMTAWHRFRGRLLSRLVHATIVNSPASGDSVIEQENADPETVSMIPNGVDLSRFENHVDRRWATSLSERKPIRIGMLTNLRTVKRVDVFLKAATRINESQRNIIFEIAGEGELRAEFESFIDENSLSNHVKLLGAVQGVPEFLQQLDLYVSCSESEGLSNSTLEAMASGLPIIATDIPGNHSLIQHGVTGLLTPVGDDERLAAQIMNLIDEPSYSKQLGCEAHQFVSNNFVQSQMVSKYESLYQPRATPPKYNTETPAFSFKQLLKDCLFGLALVLTFPLWGLARLTGSEQVFLSAAQSLSMAPGLSGVFLRRGFYAMTLENFSRDCHVEFGTWFSHRQVKIDSGVYIGARCTIGMVDIGKNVLIGSNVDILSGKNQHNFESTDEPINAQGGTFEQISIGDGSWVGNSSVVMNNIGDECVVGAGSVVARTIPDRSIAVGNPAKVVKQR